jgi:hypothetical protein
VKIAAVGVGSFVLGATVGLLGVATLAGRYLKKRGNRA